MRIDFARGFTVIDGRNGVGKSSIFDAIEFSLLGSIGKYGDASANNETADDYIWWRGPGSAPTERFVEVGFEINGEIIPLRRTMLRGPDPASFERVSATILSLPHAPPEALRQLCASSIIRDEQIAALSLDLKESERFKRLRDALGASDADEWIKKASRLNEMAKQKRLASERDLAEAANAATTASSRLEEMRKTLPAPATVQAANERLKDLFDQTPPEAFRQEVANRQVRLDELIAIENNWPEFVAASELIARSTEQAKDAEEKLGVARNIEEKLRAELSSSGGSSDLSGISQTYAILLTSGEKVGLQDGHCPLCAATRTEQEFAAGIAHGRHRVDQLDAAALERARIEQEHRQAVLTLNALQADQARIQSSLEAARRRVSEYQASLSRLNIPIEEGLEAIREARVTQQQQLAAARQDLAILDATRLSATIDAQASSLESAQARRKASEERLGLARRTEARAKSIFDAARRASGEILNQRLDTVMPLMSEFYKRLRPHPIWEDIDYKLRGDVQRSLLLQVGEELNPQFIYSSGQRRATGLAFLLSVNLSLSWNNWKSLLLDDPVQHIDDFRSVHLAEVLAQISRSGRQIICAAEDGALADLIARHLPVSPDREGKRVTLGVMEDGALGIRREEPIIHHGARVFSSEARSKSAS
jgi:hypothetical protein